VHILAAVFFVASAYFVWRSFYKMRILTNEATDSREVATAKA